MPATLSLIRRFTIGKIVPLRGGTRIPPRREGCLSAEGKLFDREGNPL